MTDPFDFVAFKQAAIKGLYEGRRLRSEQGLFALLLVHFFESTLAAEMKSHLQEPRQTQQNRRNGKTRKTVKSRAGLLELTTPCDRSGSYQPQLVLKRQVVFTPQLEQKVFSRNGMGNSYTKSASIFMNCTLHEKRSTGIPSSLADHTARTSKYIVQNTGSVWIKKDLGRGLFLSRAKLFFSLSVDFFSYIFLIISYQIY